MRGPADHRSRAARTFTLHTPPRTLLGRSKPGSRRLALPHFRAYDLGFIRWLTLTGKAPDFLAEDELERTGARGLVARYDLIVFPGQHEYVTDREYNAVEGYRNRGGNLMFLSANNFFRRVVRSGDLITRAEQWRELGRPESRWMGVQYVDWNLYQYGNQPLLVVGRRAAPWLFRKTGLRNGSRFGRFGIEIDARTAFSPPGTRVLATLPDIFGPGKTGEMTTTRPLRGRRSSPPARSPLVVRPLSRRCGN